MKKSEMVAAINEKAQQKPIRLVKKGNGINTEDVVLYISAEHQLGMQRRGDYIEVGLGQGHVAYEITNSELAQLYKRHVQEA